MTPSRALLLVAGVACLAYASSFCGGYQFDDYKVIVDNPAVHSFPNVVSDLAGLRPVTKLYVTSCWTSGFGVFAFHLGGIAIHATVAVLVLRVFDRVTGEHGAALAAALVFAVHPLQSEAVTYISGQATSLAALLGLAGMLAYLHGRDRDRRLWLYGVSPLCVVLAFLAKEVAIAVPMLLVLVEVVRPRPGAMRALAAHGVVLGACVVVVVVHPAYARSLAYSFNVRGTGAQLMSQIDGIWYLVEKAAWPMHLNIDPALPVATFSVALVAKAIVLVALLITGIANVRRRPWLAFGIGWLFIALAPTCSLVPRRDVINEREAYLAVAGLYFVAMVIAGRLVAARWRVPVLAAVVLALAARTTVRNCDYRSEIELWSASLRVEPNNYRALNNLGYAYELDGDVVQARRAYEAALKLRPDYAKARANLDGLNGPSAENVH